MSEEQAKRPVGRPDTPIEIQQEIMEKICVGLAEGKSLRRTVKDDGMPDRATVYNWIIKNDELFGQYAKAREAQADTLFDECLDIADENHHDTYIDNDGQERTNHDVIARAKLKIDTRKWMAGKLKSRAYGDSMKVDNTSSDGTMATKSLFDVSKLDNQTLEAIMKARVAE